jgi:RNA polymerase sigma-70 factor, ECF subfamily
MTTHRDPEDQGLVDRATRGDRAAYGALVKRYQRRVYITALQITHNPADADDLTQETFVKAYRALPQFDARSDFFTWLYRIAVNSALNFLSSAHRRRSVPLEEDELIPQAVERLVAGRDDPRERAELRQLCGKVMEAMATLKPDLRITLVLHAVEGMNQKEAAEVRDCAEGTVAWRISEARRLLRQKLSKVLGGERGNDEDVSRGEDEPFRLP